MFNVKVIGQSQMVRKMSPGITKTYEIVWLYVTSSIKTFCSYVNRVEKSPKKFCVLFVETNWWIKSRTVEFSVIF